MNIKTSLFIFLGIFLLLLCRYFYDSTIYFGWKDDVKQDIVLNNTIFYPPYDIPNLGWKEEISQTKSSYYISGNEVFFTNPLMKDLSIGYSILIPNVDIISFKTLIGGYALDNNALYQGPTRYVIDTSDIRIYQGDGYIAANKNVYFLGGEGSLSLIDSVDYDSFTPLFFRELDTKVFSPFYAKDNTSIYYRDTILTGADYDTFQLINVATAIDKNNTYYLGEIR